jgi:hypothetical protein
VQPSQSSSYIKPFDPGRRQPSEIRAVAPETPAGSSANLLKTVLLVEDLADLQIQHEP